MATQKSEERREDSNAIKGIPSKELFIDMLVKDLSLKDAIGDLVDNSVDAANKNAIAKADLSKFSIRISFDKNHFNITDNAGGIDEEVARKYAFKLGKPKDYEQGKHTIGQFGIGMKRAFFKLGEHITVESTALKSDFKLTISVKEWRERENEEDWDFTFDNKNIKNHNLRDTKTIIEIKELKEDAKKQFADAQFLIDLVNEISLEHLFAINKGLKITINSDKPLVAPKITLINNKDFKPAFWSHEFTNGLKAEILVGISEDLGEEGGWYIFCNDRLILGPDTSEVTGWKGGKSKGGKEGKELPKYHDQYFRFRGYVFFNADDSAKLPWTTSKTGIDRDSPEFSFVKTQMIIMAKQVKVLMDQMKKERERENPTNERMLNTKVDNATVTSVVDVSKVLLNKNSLPKIYKYPKELFNPAPKANKEIKISFSKPTKQVKKAMEYFIADSPHDAGSKAFTYFYENQFGKK
jgi:hypothetical protein